MPYASVVFSLAIEGPFDYKIPPQLLHKVQPGVRVWVPFRNQRLLGYVVGKSGKTKIKQLKDILEVIDEAPILDKHLLLLTRQISEYYCCSFGEAIDTALPLTIRKGKRTDNSLNNIQQVDDESSVSLIHDPNAQSRLQKYLDKIKKAYQNNSSVIILLPDLAGTLNTKEIIARELNLEPLVMYRKHPEEMAQWNKIRSLPYCVVVGMRSAIFAPVNNLGLIIIDEEENSVYKQDQVPHYHAREAALMRADICGAKVILGTAVPSLEAFYRHKPSLKSETTKACEIKIIDTKEFSITSSRDNIIFSKYITGLISANLNARGKTLIFTNRKGFANFAACRRCGEVLKCPRCSSGLIYHFELKSLNCRHCNFTLSPPDVCPACNKGTIKYSGWGTEKIESEIYRLFPQAKIKIIDKEHKNNCAEGDIFIATEAIIKLDCLSFELICVLAIDNSLSRIDFRATEKVYALLSKLRNLTKMLVIQTNLPHLHTFRALAEADDSIFYKEELKQRKNLGFPPYKHMALIKLRGKLEAKVSRFSNDLFEFLTKNNTGGKIEIISVGPGQPEKLRGNFYRQILLKSVQPRRITKFLKINLKKFRHSGIIITVDVDPL